MQVILRLILACFLAAEINTVQGERIVSSAPDAGDVTSLSTDRRRWRWFKRKVRKAKKAFKKAGKKMGKGFKKAGKKMRKGFKKAGKTMGKGLKKVGKGALYVTKKFYDKKTNMCRANCALKSAEMGSTEQALAYLKVCVSVCIAKVFIRMG